ncbi:MAG TPA: hypothetical protein VMR17_11625 [Xanthobacteraceae bacterium]|jgi:hypothetical protein|nr:hypothetical protein [Xanthobacteraceae bacterium]
MKTFPATSVPDRAGSAGKKYLHLALALAALVAAGTAPAFAQNSQRPLHMYAGQAFGPTNDVPDGAQIDAKRAAAVHDCSVEASKFSNASWQTAQFAAYSTCMTEHGQIP